MEILWGFLVEKLSKIVRSPFKLRERKRGSHLFGINVIRFRVWVFASQVDVSVFSFTMPNSGYGGNVSPF
jgi:hypothetical protein